MFEDSGSMTALEVDRTIYATVLDKWLKVDDKKVFNQSFNQLDFFLIGIGYIKTLTKIENSIERQGFYLKKINSSSNILFFHLF